MKLFAIISPGEWRRIFRFYQAGIINAVFGYSAYAAFVALGLDIFSSQILSHLSGMIFNFLTYGNYVFKNKTASIGRYIAVYLGQYLISLSALAAANAAHFNPYVAGLIAIGFISVVNYFSLKRFVYTGKARK